MFTRLDHVTIAVPDLQQGIAQYTTLGFNVHAAGIHPGRGTHNAIAFNGSDYLELLAIRDLPNTPRRVRRVRRASASTALSLRVAASARLRCRAMTSPPMLRPCAGVVSMSVM